MVQRAELVRASRSDQHEWAELLEAYRYPSASDLPVWSAVEVLRSKASGTGGIRSAVAALPESVKELVERETALLG